MLALSSRTHEKTRATGQVIPQGRRWGPVLTRPGTRLNGQTTFDTVASAQTPLHSRGHRWSLQAPARRINEIVQAQRRISADTALRLARFFGTSERFWVNLQAGYDLEAEKDRLGDALEGIRPLSAAS
jgi:plasmid maintenance system antidote protein VapI